MIGDMYTALAELIQRSLDENELASIDFIQEYGSPRTRNSEIHDRQSIIRALLRRHPVLAVVEDEAAEGGQVKIIDPSGGSPLLLKPLTSLVGPSPANPDAGLQQDFFGIPAGEPLIAYELSGKTKALYKGEYRRIQKNGRAEFQVVGELRRVWSDGGAEPVVFDQDEDNDWMSYLYDREEEDGTIL